MHFLNLSCFSGNKVDVSKSEISQPLPQTPTQAANNPWAAEVERIRIAMGANVNLGPTSVPVPPAAGQPLCCKKEPWKPALPTGVAKNELRRVPVPTPTKKPDARPAHVNMEQEGEKWNPLHCSPVEVGEATAVPVQCAYLIKNGNRPTSIASQQDLHIKKTQEEVGKNEVPQLPYGVPRLPTINFSRPRVKQADIDMMEGAILGSTSYNRSMPHEARQRRRRAIALPRALPQTPVEQAKRSLRTTTPMSVGEPDLKMRKARELLEKVNKLSRSMLQKASDDGKTGYILSPSVRSILVRAQRVTYAIWRLLKDLYFDTDALHFRDESLVDFLIDHVEIMAVRVVPPKSPGRGGVHRAASMSMAAAELEKVVKDLLSIGVRIKLASDALAGEYADVDAEDIDDEEKLGKMAQLIEGQVMSHQTAINELLHGEKKESW